jgi:hypothetical protein
MSAKSRSLLLISLLLFVQLSARGQEKKLVKEWVNKDVEGVSSIVRLIPFEHQNVERLKVQLKKNWHVEETDLGFKAKYLEIEKGWGYSKGYVHALIYDGRVARYEAGIESYSEEWPQIRDRVRGQWEAVQGPDVTEDEHGLVFKQTLKLVLTEYEAKVASTLGKMTNPYVTPELFKSYAVLIDPMENETLSGTHRNEGIEALANTKRIDLLENVLRGYNPGARVLAALTLLEQERSGVHLSPETHAAMDFVMNLNIDLHACVYDMCSSVTATEALKWFDSGLAWPRIRTPQKKP